MLVKHFRVLSEHGIVIGRIATWPQGHYDDWLVSSMGRGQHLSPASFSTSLYLTLSILPMILLIFWLVRVRFTNAYKGEPRMSGQRLTRHAVRSQKLGASSRRRIIVGAEAMRRDSGKAGTLGIWVGDRR
jgi:hypothetical protein